MELQTYTDDGERSVDLNNVDFDVHRVVEMLHDKKILTDDDVNSILPGGVYIAGSEG